MPRFASVRTPVAAAALAALLGAAPSPAGGDDPWRETGEWWRSPIRGTEHRLLRHGSSGEKALVAPDGTVFPSIEAAARAEAEGLPRADAVAGAALREAAEDPARRDVPALITFRLGSQPLHDVGDAARRAHAPRFAAILREQREILGRIAGRRAADPGRLLQAGERADEERRLLTGDERARLRDLREGMLGLRRRVRREVLAEARAAAEREQAPVVAWLEGRGGLVVARAVVVNAVTALVAPRVALEAVEGLPGVHGIDFAGVYEVGLNVSVPTIGASSWTSNSYDGSSSTKVCVIDTGIDSSHPALDNGVVTDAAVFLNVARLQSDFNDNANSTDDLQFHGTHVGGIVMSTDSTFLGVAPGGALMNGKAGYRTTSGGGSLFDPDIFDAGDWAADNGADVFNCSFGGSDTTDGSSTLALFFDAMVHDLNISAAISAGNSGSSSGTILTPADAFNVVTVGAFDDAGSTTHSDNSLASFSSRGPCSDGRRKPDLSAPGVNIASCFHDWEGNGGANSDFVGASGTSMAAPHVAGALCILEDFGSSWAPESMKALLLANVRNTSPYATSPDNNWGYGGLDMAAAYTNRACVIEGSLTSSGASVAFFRAPSLASGGRTTLCWNRQVVSDNDNAPTTYYSLVDLDLHVYDEADGSADGSSASGVNSVEQVKLSSALTSPVVKVRRAGSFPSGVTSQDFSVAAEASGTLSSVAAPSLACTFTAAPTLVKGGVDFTVSVRADNGGGLPAFAPSVTLTLPAGYSIQSGANPQALAKIDGGASGTATWTVRSAASGTSGSRALQAAASTSSFGETFSGASAASNHDLDLQAPTGSVSVAGGPPYVTSTDVTLTVSATDDLSGVASMRFSNDGINWSGWEAYAETKSWALASGADGARTVRVQFRDSALNESSSFTDDVVLDTTPPAGTVTAAGGAAWTAVRGISLALTASDATSGVADMRFGPDGTTFGPWLPFDTAATFNLSAGDGAKTVYAQFRDAAGLVSSPSGISDAVGLDQTAPSGTVEVAGGATYATTGTVALALTATDPHSGVADMRFSNDGTTFGSWAPFAASTSWALSAGDGPKTVHAQFRDAVGNVTSPAATDGIVRDGTAPSGSLSIDAGAVATASTSVTLGILATDGVSGVVSMRLRDGTGTFGLWRPYATGLPWTLPSGDAPRTVGVQFMDNAGNVSFEATDAILLDQTPPTGAISILGGREAINTTAVTVDVGYSDNLSGVTALRLSNDGAVWSPWLAAASTLDWALEAGEGTRTVHFQAQDAAGNVSDAVLDSILLDVTEPTGTFVLNGDRRYLLGAFPLVAETASGDGPSGSGVVEFRASHDGGATWTAWLPIGSGAVEVPRPAGRGLRRVTGEFRDLAGNLSAGFEDAIHLVEDAPQSLAAVKKVLGTLAEGGDVDAYAVDLVAGDVLSLKGKPKPPVKGLEIAMAFDLHDPDGEVIFAGRYPADLAAPGVKKFVAARTGQHTLVLRTEGADADVASTYSLGVKIKAAKANLLFAGDAAAGVVPFPAARGGTVSGSLTGNVVPPVLLSPPGGDPAPLTATAKGSVLLLAPAPLDGATGGWEVRFASVGAVTYKVKVKPARRLVAPEDPDAAGP